MMIEAHPTGHKPVPHCSASKAAVPQSALAKVDPANGQSRSPLCSRRTPVAHEDLKKTKILVISSKSRIVNSSLIPLMPHRCVQSS